MQHDALARAAASAAANNPPPSARSVADAASQLDPSKAARLAAEAVGGVVAAASQMASQAAAMGQTTAAASSEPGQGFARPVEDEWLAEEFKEKEEEQDERGGEKGVGQDVDVGREGEEKEPEHGDASERSAGAAAAGAAVPHPQAPADEGDAFLASIDYESERRQQFKPTERRVPSSPLARVAGFGGLAARLVFGAVSDTARRVVGAAGGGSAAATSSAGSSPAAAGDSGAAAASDPSSASSSSSSSAAASAAAASAAYANSPAAAVLSEAQAERLAAGLCRMRGAALKVGQMLSIQDESMVPPQLAAILEKVRDGANVMPQSQLERVMASEFGADWRERLAEFEDQPMAAASIGQVHRATLKDGRRVAMKIQYPGVARSISSDISNLKRVIQLVDFLPPGLYIDESMQAAEEELTRECDYEAEASYQRRYRGLVADEPMVSVPAVVDEFSTPRVLTSELIHGMPIDRLATYSKGNVDQAVRDRVASVLLRTCLRELFEFRFMQTDPNWSNFLYNPRDRVVHLIDFGACHEYPKEFVDDYLRMVHACAERDREGVIETGIRLGFLTGDESKAMFDAHVESGFIVGEPFATDEPYDFAAKRIPERVGKLAHVMLKERLTAPPKEAYTLHRKLSGAFLSCAKLKAAIPCRQQFMQLYDNYEF